MDIEEVSFASIEAIGTAYREGALDPPDCVRQFLDRIGHLDDRLHAFVEVYEPEALAEAEASSLRHWGLT